MTRYWYCAECPLSDECSPSNFKSWACWGYSEESCRAQVLKHLRNSGKHKEHILKGENRDDVYKELVGPACLNLVEDIYEAPPEPKRKKARGKGDGGDEEAIGAVRGSRVPRSPSCSPPRSLSAASAGAGRRADALTDLQTRLATRTATTARIPMARAELKEVSDSLQTCINSARHAQRLSAMASKVLCGVLIVPRHSHPASPPPLPSGLRRICPPGGALMKRVLGMGCSARPLLGSKFPSHRLSPTKPACSRT